MDLQSQLQALRSLPNVRVSGLPKQQLAKLARSHIEQFPFLKRHPDFVQFLETCGGAHVGDPEDAKNPEYAFATLFGVGDFAIEGAPEVDPDGFYVFCVIELRESPYSTGQPADAGLVTCSFAFDSTDSRPEGVYAEVHPTSGKRGAYRRVCGSFSEWLQAFIRASGRLLPVGDSGELTSVGRR
jgi:hypothetical protein